MSEGKHTPTPWNKIEENEEISITAEGTNLAYDILSLPLFDDGSYGWPCPELNNNTQRANADFIIKAVNSHDQIVEALELACTMLDNLMRCKRDGCCNDRQCAVFRARKAAGEEV